MDPIRFGLALRALRRHRRLRQVDVAALAGVSDSLISRLERGLIESITCGTLEGVARALGARLDLVPRWQGEAMDRLLDEDRAQLVAAIAEVLRRAGWEMLIEATFAKLRETGSIDLLAFHPATRILLVVECKSVVPDAGNSILTLDRKTRLAREIASDRGWPDVAGVARVLVLADGRTTRRRIARHGGLFAAAFPVVGRQAMAWLRAPHMPTISGLVYLAVGPAVGRGRSRVDRSRRIPTPRSQVETTRRTAGHRERGRDVPRVDSSSNSQRATK